MTPGPVDRESSDVGAVLLSHTSCAVTNVLRWRDNGFTDSSESKYCSCWVCQCTLMTSLSL